MPNLFHQDPPGIGLVYLSAAAPPPAQAFGFLRARGVEVANTSAPDVLWALRLEHREWGEATLACMSRNPTIGDYVGPSNVLLPAEREAALAAGWAVTIRVPATHGNVLRDRKRLLRYLRALMDAEDAVVALDLASTLPWSRDGLDDELAHDADLDVSAIYGVHVVGSPDGSRADWLHTHGLGDLGAFDIDVLYPASLLLEPASDVIRALAFAIVEEKIGPATERFELARPDGTIQLVPAGEFQRRAAAEHRAVREPGEDPHVERRAVVCDPTGRFAFRSAPSPSRFLSAEIGDQHVLVFSGPATELMAERARATIGVFAALREELGPFGGVPLAKCAFTSATAAGNEHIWLEADTIGADSVEGRLVNEPFDVPGLHAGDVRCLPVSALTDWMIATPMGPASPRSTLPARIIRSLDLQQRAELAAALSRESAGAV